ncbi:hypothetical protein [Allostreptomyces psammosilenae]|uniref:MinD-like ATPase involved in chromosome partitioning or flagellar assembly n=1 Tax=Allostreptomyces psammosilenae TaxID=1892865 RepID=A0A852ZPR9_9ACTN|nr:hypothetical protein [Allostreptomyces psammosilenae]NYI03250.1 hypothetical protein [Allostreptomyces psammosilenae]
MTLVAVVGGPGAPGATSTAVGLLLTWALDRPVPGQGGASGGAGQGHGGRRVLLAECDPDGGAVAAGTLQGRLSGGIGLHRLAMADRQGRLAEGLDAELVDLSDGDGSRLLLPGFSDPVQAAGLMWTWEPLAELLAVLEHSTPPCDVIVDLGRAGAFGPGRVLARRADVVLVVVRGTLRSISAARPRVAALRADLDANGTGADAVGLVLVEEGPYRASEVGAQLGAPVLGLLPHDPENARVLSDGGEQGRRFARSGLLRALRSVGDEASSTAMRRRIRIGGDTRPIAQAVPSPSPAPAGVPGQVQGHGAGPGQAASYGYPGYGSPQQAPPAPAGGVAAHVGPPPTGSVEVHRGG